MSIEFIQGTDDKLKANIYTLKKTENGKSAVIKVIDYDGEGVDNHDGVVVVGDSSIFTADEIKGKLLAGYRNTVLDTTTKNGKEVKLPNIGSSEKDGKIKFEENKECSLGSLAKRLAVEPAATAHPTTSATPNTTTNPVASTFTAPEYKLPNFGALSTGMPMIDTSMFETNGYPGNTAMPSFNFAQYQQTANMANGIGALLGVLSACGGENNFASSFMLPFLMSAMMPNIGNFFTSAPAPNTAAPSSAAPAPSTTPAANTAAPSSAAPVTPSSTSSAPAASTEAPADDVVVSTKKEQEALAKEKNVTTHTNGTYTETFTDKNGDKIEDVRAANSSIIARNRYYKGTNNRRTEWFQGENKGKITKAYTGEKGNRIVETYKRVADNKLVLQKKYVNGEVAQSAVPTTTEARSSKVDAKIKSLNAQLAEAQKAFSKTTGDARIEADRKITEIKEKIENQNSIKNSVELKKLDAELVIAKAKHANAKTSQEGQQSLKAMVRIENKIAEIEKQIEEGEKTNINYTVMTGL